MTQSEWSTHESAPKPPPFVVDDTAAERLLSIAIADNATPKRLRIVFPFDDVHTVRAASKTFVPEF